MQRPNSISAGQRRSSGQKRRKKNVHSMQRFMQPLLDFAGGKGASLSYCQNSAKMSGGCNKAGYEKLIHLVPQTESSI